jgi:hypothetical protein
MVLESLDISFNRFSSSGLSKFIRKISESTEVPLLKNLNVAGNALNVHYLEQDQLNDSLKKLIVRPIMQHVDLSLCGLNL